jgi:hypothetical protein
MVELDIDSGDTSKVSAASCFEVTVRQAPFTATESPTKISDKGRELVTVKTAAAPRLSYAVIRPIVSTNPVNIKAPVGQL